MKKKGLFSRNVPGTTEILRKTCVGIAGCGGLGSNAAVSLVRSGVGKLILADFDTVEESNLNRQYYFQSDVGKKKIEALSCHLKSINPEVQLETADMQLTPSHIARVFSEADILIEAFDRAESKSWLIEAWSTAFPERHVICASGISGIGGVESIKVRHQRNIHVVGDETSDMGAGLCAARVAVAANMEAHVAIELLTKRYQGACGRQEGYVNSTVS
jgi:sulfur carrier protein ThiS adenylyltransferase